MMNRCQPPVSDGAISCVKFLMLRETCHSLAACWQSSCSHLCYCWQRSPWPSRWWPPAESAFDPGSRQSRRGRAWGCPCRNTPGHSSRSPWTGSSKGSRAALWWWKAKIDQILAKGGKVICPIKRCCKNSWDVSLTIRIAYSQLGWILYILYDSSPFDFPQLTLSVSSQTDTLHVGWWRTQAMLMSPPWLHICTKKLQTGLTVFQSWPLEWSCLASKWNCFRCNGPSQTGPAVWQFQTTSPWTARTKAHRSSKANLERSR